MNARIEKSVAMGCVVAPPSKSMAHRYLICAALSPLKSTISNLSLSDDIIATIDCLRALGANIELEDDKAHIIGVLPENFSENYSAFCNESGSTLRFLIPILLLSENTSVIQRSPSLAKRPLDVFINLFEKNNILFKLDNENVILKGKLLSGNYEVPANVSSQFISGLLFALPLLYEDSTITLLNGIESKDYINMTIAAQALFGVNIEWKDDTTIFIKGNQEYTPCDVAVEGDFSNSAFFGALNAIGSEIYIDGLFEKSLQGDKVFFDLADKFKSFAPVIDLANCPDLGPILMTLATYFNGAHFINTGRLKIKESDRGVVMAEELKKFGADISVLQSEIIVKRSVLHTPEVELCGHNDHRVVMSLAVLCTAFGGTITGVEAVNKSFPDFFEKIKSLGIRVDLYDK